MATPYKRVKLVRAINGELGTHNAGATVDLPSAVAEVLIGRGEAKLLGAGSPPAAKDDVTAPAAPTTHGKARDKSTDGS